MYKCLVINKYLPFYINYPGKIKITKTLFFKQTNHEIEHKEIRILLFLCGQLSSSFKYIQVYLLPSAADDGPDVINADFIFLSHP